MANNFSEIFFDFQYLVLLSMCIECSDIIHVMILHIPNVFPLPVSEFNTIFSPLTIASKAYKKKKMSEYTL